MMDQFCIELAANLTHQYHSPSFFDVKKAEPLSKYLSKNGVLISMCILSPECDDLRPDLSDHWSGSWLQESTTGVRFINNHAVGVGVVLNPETVRPTCVYPIDGATLDRHGNGCGKFRFDGSDMMTIWQRLAIRVIAYYRKFRYFPHTAWKDIPCSKFMDDTESPDSVAFRIDHQHDSWASMKWLEKKIFETILGHTVCLDDTVADIDDDTLLLYAGDTPWKLEHWNETMSTMKSIVDQFPSSTGLWNEVVFEMPPGNRLSSDMIQAVFYYGSSFRGEAAYEAKRLGNLPLLQLNLAGEVFRCDSEGIEETAVA